jgi:NAD(P)-dependent dehydrogenase (short-subunit alcohol dehydrogenase family)
MSTVLVIGASQGLGLEWVKYYKAQGYDVIATTRNLDLAIELRKILTGDGDKLLQLDVVNEESVSLAINQISYAPDITIYNAGVKGYTKSPNTKVTLLNAILTHGETSSREAGRKLAFEVNAHGFDRVMHALQDKLLAKPQATVVYISTGVAETSQNTGGGYPFYRQSKAAGESYAKEWDLDLLQGCTVNSRPRVFSIVPGLINTGMGAGIDGAVEPAKRIAEMATVIEHVKFTGDTFGVWKYDGNKHMQHQLPEGIKVFNTGTQESAVKILARDGLYPTNKIVIDQSQPTSLTIMLNK